MTATPSTGMHEQHWALGFSTLAFTVCFAVWTIFSIIGVQIKEELGLSETEFGLLVGTPILTGSLIRIILGIWTDQYGGRRIYTLVMLSAAVATWLLTYAKTYPQMLVAALGVGIAGGAFSVGVACVSRWDPAGKQGTALGIFGAGNVGAAVTKFLAPFVLVAYGWQTVAHVWAIAIALMGIVFWFATDDDPVLRFHVAIPAQFAHSPLALRYVLATLEDVLSNASDYFCERHIAFDHIGWQRVLSVAASTSEEPPESAWKEYPLE